MIAEIITPGLQTTIQDLGRPGLRHVGVPLSGAADPLSLSLANAAAGNLANAAGLECTLQGPVISFHQATTFAIGGADMDARLNDARIENYAPHQANAGDELKLGASKTGARTYLAFQGGLQGGDFLGSLSTYLPATLGGHEGRALSTGDMLYSAQGPVQTPQEIPQTLRPQIAHDFFLRALPGPEAEALHGGALEQFFSQSWSVGRRANRMGIQLEGDAMALHDRPPMASSPVFPGTVQCPQDGAPFLLLCDAQTVGGYPRIAQIISADIHLAGQMRPGDRLWFRQASEEDARDIAKQIAAFYGKLIADDFFR